MSLLRIRATFPEPPLLCLWALVDTGKETVLGESLLSQLPRTARRVQLLIPAAHILITKTRLPAAGARRNASLLAYAVEENLASETDGNQVSWLASTDSGDVLAVIDRKGLSAWRAALAAVGILEYDVVCETLMLPRRVDSWSHAWNGHEGFVRTGEWEGAATDRGDRETPPLSLQMLIEDAKARNEMPANIAIYPSAPEASPDLEAWGLQLGVELTVIPGWNWWTAPPDAGGNLVQTRPRWRPAPGVLARLRPVAWIIGTALAIHLVALVVDWTRLAGEQQDLNQRMEARFREAFPATIAVADPALQMRRKLADARHAANRPDDSDFALMLPKVAIALKALPTAALRSLSYDHGRMTITVAVVDDAGVQRLSNAIQQAGLRVDASPAIAGTASETRVLSVTSQ